jgi:IS30 family transposase
MGKIYEHLSVEERGVIFTMKMENRKSSEIALALQRSRSTISRELRRNNWKPKHERGALGRPPVAGGYNATLAGRRAAQLRHKPRRERKQQPEGALWAEVRQHLDECHSPEQISAELKRTHPDEAHLRICRRPLGDEACSYVRAREQRNNGTWVPRPNGAY